MAVAVVPPVATLLRGPGPPGLPSAKHFRFWVDYQVLSSAASAALLEQALIARGGVRTGGPPKYDPITGAKLKQRDYGYMHMGEWDMLWSITAKAMLAAEILRPGQLVSIVPGFLSITRKTSLVRSLRAVYGEEGAWKLVPRTFKLPEEMDDWAAFVSAQPEPQRSRGLWMLKNNAQRGEGLRLVAARDAFGAAWETTHRPGLAGMKLYRWYLAQQYIANPLLIKGRKFGIRVWACVSEISPLRAYMHANGLVLFSSHAYDPRALTAPDGAEVAPGHVTNYAQNENGDVWSLAQLRGHLGPAAFDRLWRGMQVAAAHVFAAALPRAKEVQTQMALPPRSTFQFFGLDFLVDEHHKAWLLEVNATPSMKVEHSDPATKRLIHSQKAPVVNDLVDLMGIGPDRFREPPTTAPSPQEVMAEGERELARRGGFVPLMHLFPQASPEGFRLIPWTPMDNQLRTWTRSRTYQATLAPP